MKSWKNKKVKRVKERMPDIADVVGETSPGLHLMDLLLGRLQRRLVDVDPDHCGALQRAELRKLTTHSVPSACATCIHYTV